jgi:hypothetical protein
MSSQIHTQNYLKQKLEELSKTLTEDHLRLLSNGVGLGKLKNFLSESTENKGLPVDGSQLRFFSQKNLSDSNTISALSQSILSANAIPQDILQALKTPLIAKNFKKTDQKTWTQRSLAFFIDLGIILGSIMLCFGFFYKMGLISISLNPRHVALFFRSHVEFLPILLIVWFCYHLIFKWIANSTPGNWFFYSNSKKFF